MLHGGRLAHYDPLGHRLGILGAAPEGHRDRPALVVTGVPWRTGWKYTERGFRHLYWDCGTMLSQLLAVAPEARVWLGFVDEDARRLVGADGVHEHPLAVVTFDAAPPDLCPPPDHAVPTGHLAPDPIGAR